ncbi:hypothetical protein [Nocardia sp. NPDC050717]|uniref:hypothetical protein n=1 Tax=Nocardia sp. NPDC050717 TaxID=3157221 RepID=UPI0033EB1357
MRIILLQHVRQRVVVLRRVDTSDVFDQTGAVGRGGEVLQTARTAPVVRSQHETGLLERRDGRIGDAVGMCAAPALFASQDRGAR